MKTSSLFKYGLVCVALVVSGIFLYLSTLDINQYKPVLIQTVKSMTGRELRIDGELKLSPSLTPIISVQGLALANAPWSGSGANLLTVGKIEASAALLPLMAGRIHIVRFSLHDVKLSLETNAEGSNNWGTGSAVAATDTVPGSQTGLPPVSIDYLDIRNIDIVYSDSRTGISRRFNIQELTTEINDTESPLSFTLNASYDDYPLRLAGSLGSVDTLLANKSYPVNIKGQLADTFNLHIAGAMARPMEAEGIDVNVSVETKTLADLNRFGGTDLPPIGPVSLTGNLKYSVPGDVDFDALNAQAGPTILTGRFSYHQRDRKPLLTLQLQSELIDLQSPAGAAEEGNKPEYLFPRTPLPISDLSLLDIDASLAAKQVKSSLSQFDDLQLAIKLTAGELDAVLVTASAGGSLEGTLIMDSTRQIPSSSIELSGTGIQLGRLPHDSNKPWFSDGPVDLQIKGNGHGNSAAEIAGSFTGAVLVNVGQATMPNSSVDLFGADILMSVFNRVNPLATREPTTLLECAVINLQIRDGIAKIDRQIAMQTSHMSMAGSGEINFQTEQLNLGIKPYAREGVGINLGDLTSFAKVGGTLVNPRAEIDSQGAMKAGLTAGAAVATGGLSLLAQGLYNKNTRDSAPCETALGKTVHTPQPPKSETSTEKKEGGLLNNVKGGFKKLFGN